MAQKQRQRPPISRHEKQHQVIYDALLERILSRRYGEGAKFPTQEAICTEFEVSRSTVIHALSDLKSHGYLVSIQGAGCFVSARFDTDFRLGLIIPGVVHLEKESAFPALQHQIMRQASQLGWQLLLGDSRVDEEDEDIATQRPVELARRLIKSGVRAVIFAPHEVGGRGEAFNANVLAELSSADVSVVLLGRDIVDHPLRSNYDLVCSDNSQAGQMVGRHLLSVGARRVAFIRTSLDFPTPNIRLEGLRHALGKGGCELPPDRVFTISSSHRSELPRLLEKARPDAIVCDCDHNAAPVMLELLKLGIKIPEEIKMASFDDAPIASLLPVPLTTVSLPAEALAIKTISTLRERRERKDLPPVTLQIQCKLIVRESTKSQKAEEIAPKSARRPRAR